MPEDRKKVGDVDPAGKKAFAAETAKARKPAASPKPAAPAAPRRVREILKELADAMDPDEKRELRRGPEGKTIDQVVDEAISGAKEDPT